MALAFIGVQSEFIFLLTAGFYHRSVGKGGPIHPRCEIKVVHQMLELAICPTKTVSSWLIVRDPHRSLRRSGRRS